MGGEDEFEVGVVVVVSGRRTIERESSDQPLLIINIFVSSRAPSGD